MSMGCYEELQGSITHMRPNKVLQLTINPLRDFIAAELGR